MQCCGSVMFIPDPDFYPSRIQKQKQKREVKKNCHTFFCSHKFHKIENSFIFEMLKKKIWANFQRIIELFTQKIVTKLSKIWAWDPGSGKNLFRIQGSKMHRIRIRNTVCMHILHLHMYVCMYVCMYDCMYTLKIYSKCTVCFF
jgi:hypothetical protein